MKIFIKNILLIFFSLFFLNCYAQTPSSTIPSLLTKGPTDRFIGNVWVQYFVRDSTTDFLSSKVIFEPKARSNWHKHTGKQIVFAIDGVGYYKEKGKPIQVLKKGDFVAIEPGTIHSHGSYQNNSFTQAILMNKIQDINSTIWLNSVNEDELILKK